MSLGDYTESRRKDITKIVTDTKTYETKYANITKSKNKEIHRFEYIDEATGKKYYEEVELTDEEYEFRKYTDDLRYELRNGSSMDDIMADAIALCKEATKRRLGMTQYDCQVEAAAAMQEDAIAEMKTGEGKTLVQILSAYLYALEATTSQDKNKWKSVHVLTANDYLAKRDKTDNQKVFKLLGLSTGYAYPQSEVNRNKKLIETKKEEYMCDIVYATASTVAYDHLEDHNIYDIKNKFLKRPLYKAIVDEADDILLDQATVPLILQTSTGKNDMQELYDWAYKFIMGVPGYRDKPVRSRIVPQRDPNVTYHHSYFGPDGKPVYKDCIVFKDSEFADLSDELSSEIFSDNKYMREIKKKYEPYEIEYAVSQCILARAVYEEHNQYEIKVDEAETKKHPNEIVERIVLTDSNTGRSKDNSRYEGGMQEAIEAKEAYKIEYEKVFSDGKKHSLKKTETGKILGKITYPAFTQLYERGFVGMTGTSDDEEFLDIYGKYTYHVDPRVPSIRKDEEDSVYLTEEAKFDAILSEVLACQKTGQPVLIGTINVAESDKICKLLEEKFIRFERLDAVNSSNEDAVKLRAGLLGAVTVATNMAGRGIDIKLGEGVKEVGGLYVIGSSKNKNRRIDNQLKGRTSRQGNPGKTKYFMSLDDILVKTRFGMKLHDMACALLQLNKDKIRKKGEKVDYNKLQITNKKMIKQVNKCQLVAEGQAKSIRKHTEEKESKVYTQHKNVFYSTRDRILESSDEKLKQILFNNMTNYVDEVFKTKDPMEIVSKLNHVIKMENCYVPGNLDDFKINVMDELQKRFDYITTKSPDYFSIVRKDILKTLDDYWKAHMTKLDLLWTSDSFYAYSSKDPLEIYQINAMKELNFAMSCIKNEILTYTIYPSLKYGAYDVESKEDFSKRVSNAQKTGVMTPHMKTILDSMQLDYVKREDKGLVQTI